MSQPELRTTRRGFLGASATVAALAALGRLPPAAFASTGATGATPPPHGGFFVAAERDVLAAVAERIVPAGESGMPTAEVAGVVARVDALCARLDPELTTPLPWLVRTVQWGPPLFDGRLARFTGLDARGQDASLRGWMASRLELRRLGFQALRNLCLLGYYASPATWEGIGYAGPLLRQAEAEGAQRAAGERSGSGVAESAGDSADQGLPGRGEHA